ncbi:MAG TPA: helix-turn-helix transcriptional regulator [Candidatus Saccharimonadia bacterium]|jgi:transcriptional regulator with XRE-family HTH domain|nr:helix-turn-helix transcriptional regulator [Candidatus Saccharimonadia bacterium]
MAPVSRIQLGQVIAHAREDKKLSQRALARELGVPSSAISRLERGEQLPGNSPDRLARIAQTLDLDAHELYELAGYPVSETLPDLPSYLRTKYNLPEGAIDDLAEHLKLLNTEYIERDESGKSD